jgi:phosphonate transport system substrate-binding protein
MTTAQAAGSKPGLTIGAVAYEPRVVTIWDGLSRWLSQAGVPTDYVLYQTYEQQVAALLAGHIDVAWNSPLAWLETERQAELIGRKARAIAMRDSDRDLRSVVVVRAESNLHTPTDLQGKRVGVGAIDSPQATLLPLYRLVNANVMPVPVCFDVATGRHGDVLDGERAAAQALADGEVDAACMMDSNLLLFALEGVLPGGMPRVVAQTEPYDCRCLTVLDNAPAAPVEKLHDLLMEMDYNDPELRAIFDLEGLRAWKPGRTSGYVQLAQAVDTLRALNLV